MSLAPRIDRLSSNIMINGNFDFWQRNTTFSLGNGYTADRWRLNGGHAATGTVSRQSGGPDNNSKYFWRLNISVADASVAAGDNLILSHFIEGNFLRSIYGKKFTVSFYVRSAITGTFTLALQNGPNTRSYFIPVTINSANTWEKKSFKVEHDTTGTWDLDTGRGLSVQINLIPGSTYTTLAPANSWVTTTGNEFQLPGSMNFLGTTGNTLDLAQFQIIDGELDDPDYSRIARTWTDELILCQRYYEKSYALGTVPGTVTSLGIARMVRPNGSSGCTVSYKVQKRTTPSLAFYSFNVLNTEGVWRDSTSTTVAGTSVTGQNDYSFVPDYPAITAGESYSFQWVADAEL